MDTPVAAFIPVEPDIDYAALDYDQQIQHTQRIKSRILHKLTTSQIDGGVPTDKDSVELILKVADSMDKTTLSNKRNAVDEKNNDNNADILTALSKIVMNNGNSNPLMSDKPGKRVDRTEVPIEELGDFNHKDGESHIGIVNETVEAFSKRMETIAAEQRRLDEVALGLDED